MDYYAWYESKPNARRLKLFVLWKKTQPSSWPSRFSLIILGGNRQGLQVDRDKAVLFGSETDSPQVHDSL